MTIDPPAARGLCELLARLYREQGSVAGEDYYLSDHARPATIAHQVNVFAWYANYLSDAGGAVLDWGCKHAPDACLLRHVYGDRVRLFGCDFDPESRYDAFHRFAGLEYRRLAGVNDLPYADDAFDAVVGSGVLEHVAMDLEALKGLYRIVKPEGLLVVSYLPYEWSYDEWRRRRILKATYHRRLYGITEIRKLLLRSGFYPLDVRYQTFVPNVVAGRRGNVFKSLLAPLRYPFFRHSVLCCVARKMLVM